MAFRVIKGDYDVRWLPFTASVALSAGTLVEWTSGYLAAADDNDVDVAGILMQAIAATDSDYATTGKLKPVIIPHAGCIVEADTADTYVAATHNGLSVGIVDSANVDLDDVDNHVFRVVGSRASLKVHGYLKVNHNLTAEPST